MNPQTKTVARINKVDIVVIENGEKRHLQIQFTSAKIVEPITEED
jgi:hypothetical protein